MKTTLQKAASTKAEAIAYTNARIETVEKRIQDWDRNLDESVTMADRMECHDARNISRGELIALQKTLKALKTRVWKVEPQKVYTGPRY